MSVIRVLLVDDQAMVRAGFRMILGAEPGIEVVGEAGDGVQALSLARQLEPDIVLMDVRMPRMDGLEATRRMVEEIPDPPRILILTTFDVDEYVYAALRAGASGFLLKDAPPEQLIAGLRVVATGEALLAPSVTRRLIEHYVAAGSPVARSDALEQLTPRELEVLGLVARALSNSEIARTLVISEPTAKTHVARILMKLGLRDRVQAVVFAYSHGVVTVGEPALRSEP